jgi:hypothetical protein
MSIRGTLARVIEANRISGVKAYGEYDYNERDIRGLRNTNTRIQELMAQSVETGKKLNKLMEEKK